MANIFFISDTHFGHENILKFKSDHGDGPRLIRPGFSSIEEMNETIIQNWNSVVRGKDHVWHLGDVCMHREYLSIIPHLNGHKRLIPGNHDIFKTKFYIQSGFTEIKSYKILGSIIFSHIPIHPDSMRRYKINVHGHLHSTVIDSPNYINVCVEKINYTPISLEELKSIITKSR